MGDRSESAGESDISDRRSIACRLLPLAEVVSLVWPVLISMAAAMLVVDWIYPTLTSGDETAHLDYAWAMWHGHLPVFEDGLKLAPDRGQDPPVQWEAQHPPLFYLLLAPFVGPLIDDGHV